MKLFGSILAISMMALPAFAQVAGPNVPGVIRGSCAIDSVHLAGPQVFPFEVKSGERVELGIHIGGVDEAQTAWNTYRVIVGNNMGTSDQAIWGGYTFSLGTARSSREFRNPPILCPTSPEKLRLECEEENRRQEIPLERTDGFHTSHDFSQGGDGFGIDPNPDLHYHWHMTVPDGFSANLEHDWGNARVLCSATFKAD